jgi:formate/nitrite transporter
VLAHRRRAAGPQRSAAEGLAVQEKPLAKPGLELVSTPKETYEALVAKGTANAGMPFLKLMHTSIMGGAYVGMAGLLSLTVAGNLGPDVAMGVQRVIFAALFPVNLLLVLQSGCQLYTGNTATVSAALLEGKVKIRAMLRSFFLSWVGNVIGCGAIAVAAWYTGLLNGGTGAMAVATVAKKVGGTLGQKIVKAILCNWLVCMAVFLCTQAKDMTGKMVGIWFPISMFVGIGFEHSVANMFLLPAGLLAGSPMTYAQTFWQNLLPVTFGNLIAGAVIIAGGFYYQFGGKK